MMEQKPIRLVIVAMQEEFDAIKEQIKDSQKVNKYGVEGYEFIVNNHCYFMTLGKIGKVATALCIGSLSKLFDIEMIINIGTSGGIGNSVKVNDVVIATACAYYDVDVTAFGYKLGQMAQCPLYFETMSIIEFKKHYKEFNLHRGVIISGDSFVTKNNLEKLNLPSFNNPVAVEMESGAVAQSCYLLKIPCLIIRSISDIVTMDQNEKSFDVNLTVAASHAGQVLVDVINYLN